MYKQFEDKEISEKMFLYSLLSTIIIPFIQIVEILLIKLPLINILFCLLVTILSSLAMFFYLRNGEAQHIKNVYYTFIIFIVLPYVWLQSDVSSHFPLVYSLIILMGPQQLIT